MHGGSKLTSKSLLVLFSYHHHNTERVARAIAKVLDAGRRHRIPVGYPAGNPTEINRRIAQGFRFFQASSDIGLMASGARDMLSKVERSAR